MNALYVVAFLATSDDRDSTHSLRATLKFAARRGLRTVSARELKSPQNIYPSHRALDVQMSHPSSASRVITMDMRVFKKPRFVKVDDVRNGPRQMRLAGVLSGKYDKPDLVFENGDKLGLSATNIETLADAYGWESDSWVGHVVELYIGKGKYDGEDIDMVLVKPISKPDGEETVKATPAKKTPSKPPQLAKPGSNDLDDAIPF